MKMLGKRVAMTLVSVSIAVMMSGQVMAASLDASDMVFAFGGKAAPSAITQTAKAAVPKAAKPVVVASTRTMTQAEMKETKGAWVQIPVMIGRVLIQGFTRHGLNQTINRGISPGAIVNTLRNPTRGMSYISGPNAYTTKYIGPQSTVVINRQGQIVSTWGRGR